MNVSQGLLMALALSVLASGLGVVYTKHHSRQLFVELEALNTERDELETEWGRLTLEQATWATPTRVERIARERLNMTMPPAERMVIVKP